MTTLSSTTGLHYLDPQETSEFVKILVWKRW